MGRYELRVDGMSCTGCEDSVENAVEGVDGVIRADANNETGTVRIVGDEDATEEVRGAIHDAGYDVPS